MTAAADHAGNAAVLDDAADYIETRGWWAGNVRSSSGYSTCAANAVYRAADKGWAVTYLAQRALAIQVGLPLTRVPMCIFDWNDAPGRTAQEVLDALRLAAKSERTRADAIDAGGVS